jgi:hypothetical protein
VEDNNMDYENYVYKKEIDWSVLMEGFTLSPKLSNKLNMESISRLFKKYGIEDISVKESKIKLRY